MVAFCFDLKTGLPYDLITPEVQTPVHIGLVGIKELFSVLYCLPINLFLLDFDPELQDGSMLNAMFAIARAWVDVQRDATRAYKCMF